MSFVFFGILGFMAPMFLYGVISFFRRPVIYEYPESCEELYFEHDRIKETAQFISEVSWQDNEGKWHSIDDPRQSIERIKELADAYLALIEKS